MSHSIREADVRSRCAPTGAFAALSDGHCHYADEGPRDGRVVLLIHGATVPGWEFDRLVPYLHAAGLRTLRADL
ncbi:MAG: alpha/beta hydrolase, partial [Gammaproteobacteria bacterium]